MQKAWYLVEGTVIQGKDDGGVRIKLIQLAVASVGYYPKGKDVGGSFLVENHPTKAKNCLITVSVVFEEKTECLHLHHKHQQLHHHNARAHFGYTLSLLCNRTF